VIRLGDVLGVVAVGWRAHVMVLTWCEVDGVDCLLVDVQVGTADRGVGSGLRARPVSRAHECRRLGPHAAGRPRGC
jgi:hypothetical protein